MAISPREAENFSIAQLKNIQQLEEIIDEYLYSSKREFTDPRLRDRKILNELKRRYISVGWEVSSFSSLGDISIRFLEVNEDKCL